MTNTDDMQELYGTLDTRPRPEDVAEIIVRIVAGKTTPIEEQILKKATKSSLKSYSWLYSSMHADFHRVSRPKKQVDTFSNMFELPALDDKDLLSAEALHKHLEAANASIQRNEKSLKKLTRPERKKLGLFKNQGWYNKRFRACVRLEEKLRVVVRENQKYALTRIGKSALASEILEADFYSDINSACLVAYLAARMARRSVFTNDAQDRAYDEVSEMLLRRCEQTSSTNWSMIANVLSDNRVLTQLSENEKGALIARWWNVMICAAELLDETQSLSNTNLSTMVVQRGDDSSTWNQVAGAWNMARSHWMGLIYASNASEILDSVCPGKVMRLMAADVAMWHEISDGVHTDTEVWAILPKPWDVVRGKTVCTRSDIIKACEEMGVPKEGWVGERGERQSVVTKPTQELVNGVSVSSPSLAKALKNAGFFSGKPGKLKYTADPLTQHEARVVYDQEGYALRVEA